MDKQELLDFVDEMITFLRALDKVLPNKIDEELLTFLESVKTHPWIIDLLLKALPAQKK